MSTPTSHEAAQAAAREHLLLHFTEHGAVYRDGGELLVIERGEGPYVFDTRGRRHIDALSSLFCAQLGYSYGEEIGAAVASQLGALAFNTNWGTAHPPAIELAEALAERAPGDLNHVFFTNGGSEAVETAWKLAREHFTARGESRRTKAIARDRAYHGATLGALALTGVPSMKEFLGRPAIDVTHVSSTNAFRAPDAGDPVAFCARLLREVRGAIGAAGPDEVAMIIAEPVQNSGGCLPPPPGYWKGLREIADEHGILLVADSVICGFGRLGQWLGIEQEGVVPDLVTTAKGITSAYAPMGAVFARDHIAASLYRPGVTLRHGSTFGGHPLAAAIALKNIEIFERDGILEHVRATQGHLAARMEELRALPIVGDVRGAGFFRAVELVRDAEDTRFDQSERDDLLRGYLPGRLLEAGLIARADDRGDSVLQIAPPLIASVDVLDEIVDRLGEVLADAGAHMHVEPGAAGMTTGKHDGAPREERPVAGGEMPRR